MTLERLENTTASRGTDPATEGAVPSGLRLVAQNLVMRRLAQLLIGFLGFLLLAQILTLVLILRSGPAVVYVPDADLVRSMEVP